MSVVDSLRQESQGKLNGSVDFCHKHGKELSALHRFEPVCPDCNKERLEREYAEYKITGAARFLFLPERLKSCTFETYRPTSIQAQEVKKKCIHFSENFKSFGGMMMFGGVGTGKTHLAAAICNAISQKGVLVKLTTVPAIIREIRSTWNSKKSDREAVSEADVLEKYNKTAELLIIDEIGSQYGTDSEKVIISEIVNDRYNNMLPTGIIGNVTLSEAAAYLGERAIDRIKDNGLMLIFDWESHRKPKSERAAAPNIWP